MEPDDIDKIYQWENNPENWVISNTNIPFSKNFLKEFILRSSNDIVVDKQVRLIIVETSTKESIGTLDIFEYDPLHRRAGIGILIDKEKRNKGFAAEAIQLAIDFSFNRLHLHQLFCHIIKDNDESKHLFLKQNFQITGTKRDWILTGKKWHDVLFLQLLQNENIL